MVTRYLPTFNQIEPENLLGLTAGLVVAQQPVKYTPASEDTSGDKPVVTPESYGVTSVEKSGIKFFENGILCSLDADGNVIDFAAGKALFIHFTEELNTVLVDRKYFAVEANKDETFLRLVALVPGSIWTTNVETADAAAYAAAKTAGKIAVLNNNATLPDGRPAKTYICIA